jgi:hypothetical protein
MPRKRRASSGGKKSGAADRPLMSVQDGTHADACYICLHDEPEPLLQCPQCTTYFHPTCRRTQAAHELQQKPGDAFEPWTCPYGHPISQPPDHVPWNQVPRAQWTFIGGEMLKSMLLPALIATWTSFGNTFYSYAYAMGVTIAYKAWLLCAAFPLSTRKDLLNLSLSAAVATGTAMGFGAAALLILILPKIATMVLFLAWQSFALGSLARAYLIARADHVFTAAPSYRK